MPRESVIVYKGDGWVWGLFKSIVYEVEVDLCWLYPEWAGLGKKELSAASPVFIMMVWMGSWEW